jgi:hypothetical protein
MHTNSISAAIADPPVKPLRVMVELRAPNCLKSRNPSRWKLRG